MPLIDIHVLEGVFSDEEKAQLISGTAKAFGKVAGSTNAAIHFRSCP